MHLLDMHKTFPHFLAIKPALLAAIDEQLDFGRRVYAAFDFCDE